MKGFDELLHTVERISYPGFTFKLEQRSGEIFLSVVCVNGTNNVTGAPEAWSGRKWLLQRHMTNSEVVQTAFKAVLTAIEHEARELFLYRGQPVLDGHMDLDQIASLKKQMVLLVDRRETAEQVP
jgi:hypothetical protein